MAIIVEVVDVSNAKGLITGAFLKEMMIVTSSQRIHAAREKTLPAIIHVKISGTTLLAYLDRGSGRSLISLEAIRRLMLSQVCHETSNFEWITETKTSPAYF